MRQAKTFSHRGILFKTFSSFISLFFFISSVFIYTPVHAQTINTPVFMPTVGGMVNTSSSFAPLVVRGITFDSNNPLAFSFLVDPGETDFSDEQLRDESQRLINYFMTALTVPEQELWVNLSPYESERVIPDSLGQTAMGRDLLAQDYLLKQLTASLMYPESELGQTFWNNIKDKVRAAYGPDIEIPTDVYNKVWITPESAKIYIHEQSVFLTESRLKVVLEEDYLALRQGQIEASSSELGLQASTSVIRELIIPEIEKEVNTGKHFAPLRQVFQSVILASWYKNNLKQTLLAQVYADQNKVKGIDENDPANNTAIYNRYLEAFNAGVYNYIKEEYDAATQRMVPNKYFSGGVAYNNREVFSHPDSATLGQYNRPLGGTDASALREKLTVSLIAVNVRAFENVASFADMPEQLQRRLSVQGTADASVLNHNQVFEIDPANPQLARYRGHMVEELLRYRQEVVGILNDGKAVEKPVIILSDLHGASMRLGQLLSNIFNVDVQIEFDPETGRARTLASQGVNLDSIKDMEFYIGGDVFDRGPYGFLVFDIVRELAEAGAIVIPGNHEDMAIGAILNVDRDVEISEEMERVAWASWAKKWATYVSSSGSFSWGRTVIDERNREFLLRYPLEKASEGSVARILSQRSSDAIHAAEQELFDKFITEEKRLDKDGNYTDAEIRQIVEDKISGMSNFEKVNTASYALKIREFNKIHTQLELEPIETSLPDNVPVDANNFRRDPRFREVVEFYATHKNVRLFHETKSGVLITHGGVAVGPNRGVIPIEVSEGVQLTGEQYTRGLKIYEAAYKKGLRELLELDPNAPDFTAKKDAILAGDMRFVRKYMDGMYSDYTRDGKIKSRQNPKGELKPANWVNFVSREEYEKVVETFMYQQNAKGINPGDDDYIDLDQLVRNSNLTFNGFGLKRMAEQLGVNMLSFGHNPINSNYPDRPAKLDKPLEIIKFVFLRAAYETGVALDQDLKMSEGYGPHGAYVRVDEEGMEVIGYENKFSKKNDIKKLVPQAEAWQKTTFYTNALAYIDRMFANNPYLRQEGDGRVSFLGASGEKLAEFNGEVIELAPSQERDENAPTIGADPEELAQEGDERDRSVLNPTPVGGIDLNLEGMDLEIERDAFGVPLPIEQQPLMDMQIDGFLPVIINITPVTNVPLMLGLVGQLDPDETVAPYRKADVGDLSRLPKTNRIAKYALY